MKKSIFMRFLSILLIIKKMMSKDYQRLIEYIDSSKTHENAEELKLLLNLIVKISINHK